VSQANALRKVSSPYGFSMLGVEATQRLEQASRAAQDIIRDADFERIMPAMVDYPETFADQASSEIFSLKDNSGERLSLRNDITAQVIKGFVRQIETRAGHNLRKFYYAAPVYKDVRKNYPLPREIYQIGCEIIGEDAEKHLRDLVNLSQIVLQKALNLTGATQISHVSARAPFLEIMGQDYLDAEANRNAPAFADLIAKHFSLEETVATALARALFYPPEQGAPDLGRLPEKVSAHVETARKAVKDFIGSDKTAFWQPLTLPRSSYYSGLFFETYVDGVTEPIVRGGVYNDLIKRYADISGGACGFALDLLPG